MLGWNKNVRQKLKKYFHFSPLIFIPPSLVITKIMDTPQKKVLIIEDEISILNGISDKFTHEGFFVLKATNGQEGLDIALKDHPDFTIVDNLMPNTDGFYFLENIRKDKWGKNSLIIMWSNSHDSTTITRARKIEVFDFMIKSEWEYRDIVNKVREALGEKKV